MDNLTHTLTGMVLARAGLRRVAPGATLTLLLAANAPDIDVAAWAGGPLVYLHYHRGYTHAAAGLPVMAGLVTVVVWLFSRKREERFRWLATYLVALAGVFSHGLMDFTNTYGIRPWLPFSGAWYSWDISFIVDVWLLGALGLALALPALGRLISGEIGARPGSGTVAATLALVFLAGWWTFRDFSHRRALAMLEAHLYGFHPSGAADSESVASSPSGLPPLRVAAFPTPGDPLAWRGFVETEGFYQVLDVDLRRPLDPTAGRIFYKPEASPALEAALRTPTAREYSSFARYRYAMLESREAGYQAKLTDFRFSAERRNAFVCTIDLDRNLQLMVERFSF